jgi:3',5'-cyclic AMP phosphodiesterase CpdA
MTRLAHLSDLHIDGTPARSARVERELGRAWQFGAEHLIVTGDLTVSGSSSEYQELARVLAGVPAPRVTLVPGNHDGSPSSWSAALAGPLARFTASSGRGAVTVLGDCLVVPISTQMGGRAPFWRALGAVDREQLALLDHVTRDALGRTVVIAMHHGPQWHMFQPLDGLTNRSAINGLLGRGSHIVVCCGHDHRALDLGQVFTAASVAEHDDALRVYEAGGGAFVPTYKTSRPGFYLKGLGI